MKIPFGSLRWLLFGIVITGLVAAVFSLASLRSQILEIGGATTSGPVWYITGVERDVKEFQLSLASYELGRTTAQNVNLLFDILWSRVSGAGKGEVATELAEHGIDVSPIVQIMGLLRQHETTVVNVDTASPEAIQKVSSDFAKLNESVHDLGLKILQATSAETQDWQDALLKISSANSLIGLVVGVTVFILMILLLLDGISAKRQLREKDGLLVAAEAASLAKSRFISIVNHELRTPLTSINGAVSLMSAGAFGAIPEKFQQPINIAERNCAKLTVLISDLLDAEKLSSAKMEFYLEKIDLRQFLQEQIAVNQPFAETFGVSLVTDPLMPDLSVNGDPHRLGQVLANLISNAAKFSKAGDSVVVGLTKRGGRAVVCVKDTGRGIPESARARIFERFQQVYSSDVRERGGTGLGLSIVKSIIEAHGGAVTFDSVVGEGTTFRFDLSLAA